MDTGALVRRTPGWRLAVVALAFLLPAGAARADDLIVPGGRRGISAALNIPPIDRARFLSELVRLVYAPPSGRLDARVMQERLIRYLDVLGRFRIELGLVQPAGGRVSLGSITEKADRRQAATLLEMLGLKLVEKGGALSIVPAPGKDVAERAALLNALGLDASAIAARLNAGDDVRFELPMETVPAPLTAADWARFAFAKALPADQLFAALLRDRNAALIAAALGALDDGTVQYLRGNPRVLDRLYSGRAAIVYAFGSALRIENGRVRTPGGDRAAALWELVVESSTGDPDRFVDNLFGRSNGRLAYLYFAVANLDAPHAAFAMGDWLPEGERSERFRALAAAVQGAYSSWNIDERPSQRMAYDVAMLLATIRVGPDGAPQPPAWRQLWERAFSGADLPDHPDRQLRRLEQDGPVDAAWLVEHAALGLETERAERMHALAFGQRAFASASEADYPQVLVALRAIVRQPMLVLTLDRMGITDPGVYADAARAAIRLAEGAHRDAFNALGQYQSGLALVARLRHARVLSPQQAAALVRDLAGPAASGGEVPPFAVLNWITGKLAPAVHASPDGFEDALDAALSGAGSGATPPAIATVTWEDRKYRIDVPAAARARMARLRDRLGAPSLAEVAAFVAPLGVLAGGPPSQADAERAVAALARAAAPIRRQPINPPGVEASPDPAPIVARTVRRLEEALRKPRDLKNVPRIVEPLVPIAREALTDSLMALTYAVSLGAVQDAGSAGVNIARRHDFGFLITGGDETRRRGPWRMPTAEPEPGKPWHVTGSLLGLDVGLSMLRLRRVTDLLPEPPTINANEARTLSRTVALINAFDLDDAERDEIVAAIERGRQRVRGLTGQSDAVPLLAAELGLDTRRAREAAWVLANESGSLLEYFSLGELLVAGRPRPGLHLDSWGPSALVSSGCLCTGFDLPRWPDYTGRVSMGILGSRLADVTLRLAELTAQAGLPARIIPDVLDAAMQDLVDRVRMTDDDDWLTLVRAARAIDRNRFDDLAAALTAAGGPLVPADIPVSRQP